MPAAIAIPAIIGAAGVGASVYAAHKSSDAAQTAAQQQQDAAGKAQQFNQQVYDDQKQRIQPYTQAGQYALANLMARQYGGTPAAYGQPQNYGAPGSATPQPGTANMPAGAIGVQNAPGNAMAAYAQQQANPGPQQGGGMGAGSPQPPQAGPGGMVTVQDDTGQTRQVPAAQAQLYAQRGFQIVANGQGMPNRAPMDALRN